MEIRRECLNCSRWLVWRVDPQRGQGRAYLKIALKHLHFKKTCLHFNSCETKSENCFEYPMQKLLHILPVPELFSQVQSSVDCSLPPVKIQKNTLLSAQPTIRK